MDKHKTFDEESSSVQAHLSTMQNVIQRMAENSRACKLWCVTLISAVLFFTVKTEKPEHTLIALIPLVLFLILDTYYLALERAFRDSYNTFVRKLQSDLAQREDIYSIRPTGSVPKLFFRCLLSFSIYIFYIPLALMMLLVWWLITK